MRESFETQKALWTHEKTALTERSKALAEGKETLELTLSSITGDVEVLGEALEFLQWACAVTRDQTNRFAQENLRTAMEAIRELLLSPPSRRGDPEDFAKAYIAGMENGPEPKGAARMTAYRIGLVLHCLCELYASVESLAEFPRSVFNDHFENPELSPEELLDRWDERRHPEKVIVAVMGEVFETDREDESVS